MSTNKNTESSQGDVGASPPPPPPAQPEHLHSRGGNTVFKSGPLFISSKGIGWTSWKKRWFILTRTSLVFFRSDPSAIPQKGSEVNLTLGGIDLNNSGSVVVKADKKLLTVLFPDGRDGRAFTLKRWKGIQPKDIRPGLSFVEAETSEDLYEWKTALENALAQAPSAALVIGQNGIFKNDQTDGIDDSLEQSKDNQPVKFLVIGRPILLALEDVDGSPSFLEKALRFIEEHGIKVEGILRQAADVDDVEHRVREYEQGKVEFLPEEDAHVIADCIKFFLRELPSSPVPASCCNALLEACRTDRGSRVNAMRAAILETFPEPNRRLLQRILSMMRIVASHKAVNRMSSSAVAACMAPLLLRPLLAGDCDIETDFNVGGDGSIQLLKAAAAANHAQAIVITLLEEYDNIFSEGSMDHGLYSDSDEYGSEDEELTEDDESYEDDENNGATEGSDAYSDDDLENASSRTTGGDSDKDDLSDNQGSEDLSSGSKSPTVDHVLKVEPSLASHSVQTSIFLYDDLDKSETILDQANNSLATQANESNELLGDVSERTVLENKLTGLNPSAPIEKSTSTSNGPVHGARRPTVWGRTSARKNLSMESIDTLFEDEAEIQKLEACKLDLQNRISEEVKGNAVLQANLEKRKKTLHERRLALEQDVARLQEQLQKEREMRTVIEAGLDTSKRPLVVPDMIDEKMKAELEEINQAEAYVANLTQKVGDLGMQLNQRYKKNYGSMYDSSNQPIHISTQQEKWKDTRKDAEAAATSHFGRSASEPSRKQQLDQVHSSKSRSIVSTNSKRSGSRNEGVNSTTSALTKLTTRLNFLKERRSQIANELQNLDKDRDLALAITTLDTGRGLYMDRIQGSEVHFVQNLEKGRELAGSQPLQDLDKDLRIKSHFSHDSESVRKSDSGGQRP